MTFARAGDVLLDRDGVIVRNPPGYVLNPGQLELLPGAGTAIRRLGEAGHRVIVVTNQSAVGRGLLTLDGLAAIHERMRGLVASEGGHIDEIFVCPHHPADGCGCRKPKPGLLFAARDQAQVALDRAVLIGDAASDIAAARAAGCASMIVGGERLDGVDHASDLLAATDSLLADAVRC